MKDELKILEKKLEKSGKFNIYHSSSESLGDILMDDSLKIMSDGTRIVDGYIYYLPSKSSSMTKGGRYHAFELLDSWNSPAAASIHPHGMA